MPSSTTRPNVLLIMPDQMRGDCLSLAGHPALLTPNIDSIGGRGTMFRRAYSTCPSCIPARRSLLTGQFPATHGMVGFVGGNEFQQPALPQLLADAGYETALIGRNMHQHPAAKDYGYQTRTHGSCYVDDDALAAAVEEGAPGAGGLKSAGLSFNGWTARPWHLDEKLHPTTWVANKTRQFLAGRSDERPLFLTASFYAPHPPFFPPAFYIGRYLRVPLPGAAIGGWATPPPNDGLGLDVQSHYVKLTGEALRSAQAGYFGLINHIDDQICWFMAEFIGASRGRPWLIIFTSDHGEMLGDHYMFRKCEPYEGSANIPLLICGSRDLGFDPGQVSRQPVCLEDLLPTVLEIAGVDAPENIDGRSLVPLLRGEHAQVRPWLHGEHSPCYSQRQAFHMLTDGHDLSAEPSEELATWRGRLIERLRNRHEGFTDGERLIPGRPYETVLPHAKEA